MRMIRVNCRTLAVLDAESVDHYWLTVHATDHGAVPLSSKLFVYVEVDFLKDWVSLESLSHQILNPLIIG